MSENDERLIRRYRIAMAFAWMALVLLAVPLIFAGSSGGHGYIESLTRLGLYWGSAFISAICGTLLALNLRRARVAEYWKPLLLSSPPLVLGLLAIITSLLAR